jgi:L-ascorbate metabolism protein UlaG (beta-lactamase superfamily)
MQRCCTIRCWVWLAAAGLLGASGRGRAADASFLRGDANADGTSDLSDAISMLFCNFLGTSCTDCPDAADANDDGKRDVSDPIYLLNYLFLGDAAPPAPGQACGEDPTADELPCAAFAPCVVSDPDAISTSRGALRVVPVEHASLVLLWDSKAVYADPVGGAAKYAGLPPPDLIVVTHTHGDHMDPSTIRALAIDGTVVIAPQSVATAIAGGGGAGKGTVQTLANGDTTSVADVGVEAVAMYNITAGRLQNHPKGVGNGYVLNFDGTRAYVSGDTEDILEMRALEEIALAFLCMNLPYTMTPAQAASAALEFRPSIVYPYHYSGQNPADFKELVEAGDAGIEVRLRDWYP